MDRDIVATARLIANVLQEWVGGYEFSNRYLKERGLSREDLEIVPELSELEAGYRGFERFDQFYIQCVSELRAHAGISEAESRALAIKQGRPYSPYLSKIGEWISYGMGTDGNGT